MYSQDYIAGQNNGLIVGMTVGLSADNSGAGYEPKIWNDEGEYSYFYLDFKRPVRNFRVDTFNDDVLVYTAYTVSRLSVTDVEQVDSTIFKVFCNIGSAIYGFTVNGLITTSLVFQNNTRVSPFSVHAYVNGLPSYVIMPNILESVKLAQNKRVREGVGVSYSIYGDTAISESITLPDRKAADELIISYWPVTA